MLSEKLMWSSQVELPISKSFPASSELDAAFEELQIECRTETALEKRRRITIDERIERWTLFGYTLVVAAAVISSVIAMASSTLGVLEIAFFMPLITGPFVIHQKDGLIKCRKKREVIASLRLQTWRMKEANDEIRAEVDLMQKEVYRLKIVETKLKDIVEKQGHNFAAIYDLFRENKELNKVKKELAEAIGFQNLMTGILRTDTNRNHIIGDVELNLLAFRIQSIEGVPFTGREMIDRFGNTRKRSLTTLVDVVQELYIEKRREQTSEKAKIPMDGTPTKLGSHLLWKRRFDFNVGMAV